MMRDIYSHSTGALIWLGDSADDDQQAVEVLKLIDEVGWSTDAVSLEARGKLVSNILFKDNRLQTARAQLKSFDAFFARAWFSRVWQSVFVTHL
jgi:hypothetical protein